MGNVNAIRVRVLAPLALLLAGALAGCATPPPPFPDLPRLGVATTFGSKNLCGLGVSPPININNAPPATTQYRLRLTNTDVLYQQPWQTTATAVPGGFTEGALADYEAPCVGDLRVYSFYRYQTYRLEVLALDAQNRPLAYGQTTVLVQSVNATLDRERSAQRRTASQPAVAAPTPAIIQPVGPATVDTVGRQVSPVLIPQIYSPILQPQTEP
jgi:hypothetical protein